MTGTSHHGTARSFHGHDPSTLAGPCCMFCVAEGRSFSHPGTENLRPLLRLRCHHWSGAHPLMHAWRRENNRTACVRAVGSPDRTAAAGRGRPGGKKRGLANLTLTGHGLTWNVWMVASLSLSFRFISLWTLRRQGTCVLSCEYTVHCLWLDAWAGLERYVDISLD